MNGTDKYSGVNGASWPSLLWRGEDDFVAKPVAGNRRMTRAC